VAEAVPSGPLTEQVRVVPVVCSTALVAQLYALARRLYGQSIAVCAGLWAALPAPVLVYWGTVAGAGYVVVLRHLAFAGDALSHVAFSGSLGALVAGLNPLLGLFGLIASLFAGFLVLAFPRGVWRALAAAAVVACQSSICRSACTAGDTRRVARSLISSGSPYERIVGFSRAVRVGERVFVAGTAPVMPEGEDPPPDPLGPPPDQLSLGEVQPLLSAIRAVHYLD